MLCVEFDALSNGVVCCCRWCTCYWRLVFTSLSLPQRTSLPAPRYQFHSPTTIVNGKSSWSPLPDPEKSSTWVENHPQYLGKISLCNKSTWLTIHV